MAKIMQDAETMPHDYWLGRFIVRKNDLGMKENYPC